jgi:hypothetical protein
MYAYEYYVSSFDAKAKEEEGPELNEKRQWTDADGTGGKIKSQ